MPLGQGRRQKFFAELRAHLAPHQILDGAKRLRDASGFSRAHNGMVLVESEDETVQVLRSANRWGVAIHPVSTGMNFGYGEFFPAQPGVILNLCGMNRILEFNRKERWLRIESGVSQGQIAEFLKARAPEFAFDLTSWLAESSVIGNALERGRSMFAERERSLIGAKLILASGETLRTGFDPAARSPVIHGLNLHPLIFQSNLGVVSEGILRLELQKPARRYFLTAFKKFSDYSRLTEQLELQVGLRPLRWFCRDSIAEAPLPPALRRKMEGFQAGALVIEAETQSAAGKLRALHPDSHAITRTALTQPSPLTAIPKIPTCFFSFAVRRSGTEITKAEAMVRRLKRDFSLRGYLTISSLETSHAFLLRACADSPQRPVPAFAQVAKAIRSAGYVSLRDHSAMPTKDLPDAHLKKMIKDCFDPKGVISPGRYGLS